MSIFKLSNHMVNEEEKLKDPNANRYTTKSQVGAGGMGTVDAVEDTHLKRILAMKILSDRYADDPAIVSSFLREARFTAQLQHPNIIPVHDIGETPEDGTPFYTMKLIEGESLLEIITKLRDKDPAYEQRYSRFALLGIFRKVCDAVAYAHSRGIIHRDIKPANIMIGPFGEVLLVDWGLAKHTSHMRERNGPSQEMNDALLTHDGIIKGSLAYISPEQALGDISNIDRLTDIFLLGATLYHLMTFSPPYNIPDIATLLNHAEKADFIHPLDIPGCETLPHLIADIMIEAMSLNKEDRFPSVNEMSYAIDSYLGGKHVSGYKKFKRGEVILCSGEVGDEAYILASGRVEISCEINKRKSVLDICEKGAIIGELSLLTSQVRSATALALEDCEVLVITSQMVLDELRKMPPWLEKTFTALAYKLSNINDRLHPFISSNCTLPVTRQVYYIFLDNQTRSHEANTAIMGYSKAELTRLLSMNLGLPNFRVEEVIDVLLNNGILFLGSLDIIQPPDLDEVHALVKFIEREQSEEKNAGTIGLEIPVAKIRKFTQVFKGLDHL